jgi:undecaprenyl-diphosphatase
MSLWQIVVLAVVQGAAELLPVSSSAHVIVAEKLMGLDPSSPEMTFLLVMLHTGTMFAVLIYFWPRWKALPLDFLKRVLVATAFTGVIGLTLKKGIEDVLLRRFWGESNGEIETLFKSLPLMAFALFGVGLLIAWTGFRERKVEASSGGSNQKDLGELSAIRSAWIGMVQGLCLPFRGCSRSGATISTGMLMGISRNLAEDFSFALAVVLTPPVVVREVWRLLKHARAQGATHGVLGGGVADAWLSHSSFFMLPGLVGMVFSFFAGYLALHWLSHWLESGRWKYFGVYCILASGGVLFLYWAGF